MLKTGYNPAVLTTVTGGSVADGSVCLKITEMGFFSSFKYKISTFPFIRSCREILITDSNAQVSAVGRGSCFEYFFLWSTYELYRQPPAD